LERELVAFGSGATVCCESAGGESQREREFKSESPSDWTVAAGWLAVAVAAVARSDSGCSAWNGGVKIS